MGAPPRGEPTPAALDEAVAAVLADEATRAAAGSDHAVAARLYGRAASLTPDAATRQQWLLDAGVAAMHLGDPASERLLTDAAAGPDLEVAEQARLHLATVAAYTGRQAPGAAAGPPADPVEMITLGVTAAAVAWDSDAFAAQVDDLVAAHEVPVHHHHARILVAGRHAMGGADTTEESEAVLRDYLVTPDPRRATPIAIILLFLRRRLAAAEVLARALPIAREQGDVPSIAWILATQTWACLALGELTAAIEVGGAALTLGGPVVGPFLEHVTHSQLAMTHALLGDPVSVEAHTNAATSTPEGLGSAMAVGYSEHAAGLLLLTAGRHAEAATALGGLVRRTRDLGPFASIDAGARFDHVEALWRAGDIESAQASATEALEEASTLQPLAAEALAGAVLVGADPEDDEAWAEAGKALAVLPDAIISARLDLVRGERLRRARRPSEARAPLARAHDVFAARSMTVWAQRAERELAAAGAPVADASGALSMLTAQERAVALLLARGASTAEAASMLGISPRTVETHLAHVYRKLDVNRRAALAVALRELDGQA